MDSLLVSRQSLAEALSAKGIVLVVGPEAVQVETKDPNGASITLPFYQMVADELLRTYDIAQPEIAASTSHPWLLHRSVAQVLRSKSDVSSERVRRSVSSIIKTVASKITGSSLLDRIARLSAFEMFVCLTPDDLLVEALGKVYGPENVDVGAYAPNVDSSQTVDVMPFKNGKVRVFFPLGRCAAGTRLAVHEEDSLEYLYKFQEESARRAPNVLTGLRSSDLLLLGCNLPDWLGRGFLRLANENRLSAQEKKMEFFAADTQDPGLNSFLARFDPNASIFPWSPEEFVAEIELLTADRKANDPVKPTLEQPSARTGSQGAGPTIFISYASEDAEAARSMADALIKLGFGDVWLDKHKLIAGDDWSDHIDDAIEHCDFFMPLLSRQADRRREGVFWEEWRKALVRALRINDVFLLPVGIDDTHPAQSGYERIFNGFTTDFSQKHLMHAPQGNLSEESKAQLIQRCERFLGEQHG